MENMTESSIDAKSFSSRNPDHVDRLKATLNNSLLQAFRKVKGEKEEVEVLKFEEFAGFAPKSEYDSDLHQIAIKFTSTKKGPVPSS